MKKIILKGRDFPLIHKVADLLKKDVTKPFTISELAREVGINTQKLNFGFKEVYNLSIYQYRVSLQVQLGLQLLEETDLSIKEIAYKTGFDSRDSMARVFKKKLGRCPTDWRKRQENGEEMKVSGFFPEVSVVTPKVSFP